MTDEPKADNDELPNRSDREDSIFEQNAVESVADETGQGQPFSATSPASHPARATHPSKSWFLRVAFPGIESFMWMVGAFIALLAGSAVGALLFVIFDQVAHPGGSFSFFNLPKEAILASAIGSQLSIICYAGLGAFLRYGSRVAAVLGLRRLTLGHFMAILALTLPLQVLAQSWAAWAASVMQSLGIPDFAEYYSKEMQQLFEAGPIGVMWLLIALSPAIGEELVFRGLIGTTLVRHWGPVLGVLVTSVLFGIIHLIPIQAIAVIPLGMAMHYVYLTTKSFWAPVLLHLCNNSLALLVMKLTNGIAVEEPEDLTEMPSLRIIAVSLFTAVCLIAAIWQTRRWVTTVSIIESDNPDVEHLGAGKERRLESHPRTGLTNLTFYMGLAGLAVLMYLAAIEIAELG